MYVYMYGKAGSPVGMLGGLSAVHPLWGQARVNAIIDE